MEFYELTTFEGFNQFSRESGQSIMRGLKWPSISLRLVRAGVDPVVVDESTKAGNAYNYTDENGKLNRIIRYVR